MCVAKGGLVWIGCAAQARGQAGRGKKPGVRARGRLGPTLGGSSLETAQALTGSADDVALPLAQLYIASDRREEARELLEDVLHWSHGGPRATSAQELLREIDEEVASEAAEGS